MEKRYPEPAVGVVVLKGEEVLLIEKGRGLFAGQLCIPGGHIEIGEKIVETVHREIMEELNITVSTPEFITYEEHMECDESGNVTRHFVFFNFKAHYVSGSPKAGDDASKIVYVPIKSLSATNLSAPTIRTFRAMKYIE